MTERSFQQPNTGSPTVRDLYSREQVENLPHHPVEVLRSLRDAQTATESHEIALANGQAITALRTAGLIASENFWHGDQQGGRMVPHITPLGFNVLAVIQWFD